MDSIKEKHQLIAKYIEGVKEKGINKIDKEKFIAEIMVKSMCERRKAIEIINAQMIYNGFEEQKKEGRKVYIYNDKTK